MEWLYVVTVLLCIGAANCLGIDNPCTIEPKHWGQNADIQNNTIDATANTGCENGSVWWTAPWGYLRLHFGNSHPGREFRVCLSGFNMVNFQSIMDISGGRSRNMDSVPDGDHEKCSSFRSDEVTIQLQAPPGRFYVTVNDYNVEFQD